MVVKSGVTGAVECSFTGHGVADAVKGSFVVSSADVRVAGSAVGSFTIGAGVNSFAGSAFSGLSGAGADKGSCTLGAVEGDSGVKGAMLVNFGDTGAVVGSSTGHGVAGAVKGSFVVSSADVRVAGSAVGSFTIGAGVNSFAGAVEGDSGVKGAMVVDSGVTGAVVGSSTGHGVAGAVESSFVVSSADVRVAGSAFGSFTTSAGVNSFVGSTFSEFPGVGADEVSCKLSAVESNSGVKGAMVVDSGVTGAVVGSSTGHGVAGAVESSFVVSSADVRVAGSAFGSFTTSAGVNSFVGSTFSEFPGVGADEVSCKLSAVESNSGVKGAMVVDFGVTGAVVGSSTGHGVAGAVKGSFVVSSAGLGFADIAVGSIMIKSGASPFVSSAILGCSGVDADAGSCKLGGVVAGFNVADAIVAGSGVAGAVVGSSFEDAGEGNSELGVDGAFPVGHGVAGAMATCCIRSGVPGAVVGCAVGFGIACTVDSSTAGPNFAEIGAFMYTGAIVSGELMVGFCVVCGAAVSVGFNVSCGIVEWDAVDGNSVRDIRGDIFAGGFVFGSETAGESYKVGIISVSLGDMVANSTFSDAHAIGASVATGTFPQS
ncbi:hypothetical protein Plhal703r1_c53g0158881 [Plasmopara halstedii]